MFSLITIVVSLVFEGLIAQEGRVAKKAKVANTIANDNNFFINKLLINYS